VLKYAEGNQMGRLPTAFALSHNSDRSIDIEKVCFKSTKQTNVTTGLSA
jgi:hypothetical protein